MSRANLLIEGLENIVQAELDPEGVKQGFSSLLPAGWEVQDVTLNEKGEVRIVFQNTETQESIGTIWIVGEDKTPMVHVEGTDLAVDLSNFKPPTKETTVGPVIDFGAGTSWVTPVLAQVLLSGAQMKQTPEEPEKIPEEPEETPQQISTATSQVGSPEQEKPLIQ